MFLREYLTELEYEILCNKYDDDFIVRIDRNNFHSIYTLFINNGFYFVKDLIIKYLEIFSLDIGIISDAIYNLFKKYGGDYIYFIGRNLNILDEEIMDVLEKITE